MKKTVFLLAVFVLCVFMTATAFATGTAKFTLTEQKSGTSSITVSPGDTITVQLNISASEELSSFQDEIYYDQNFFQFVPNSNTAENTIVASVQKKVNGDRYVFFNDYRSNTFKEAGSAAGTFKLKVTASSGTTIIKNCSLLAYNNSLEEVSTCCTDLIVKVKGNVSYTVTMKNDDNTTFKTISCAADGTFIVPDGPEKEGYTFEYWVDEKDSSKHYTTGETCKAAANMSFKPIFTVKQYTIDYSGQTGGSVSATIDGKEFKSGNLADYGSNIVLTAKGDTGYAFSCWTDGNMNNPRAITVKGKASYTASFRSIAPTAFTLHFETNGGTALLPITVTKGSELSLVLCTTLRNGYTFEGWYSDSALTNRVISVVMDSDKTVYAKWKKIDVGGVEKEDIKKEIETDFLFVDVSEKDYYYDAVVWAVKNGITTGTDAAHFSPLANTTRGQMVTFLWRAAGCPNPTTTNCAFTDVEKGSYYEKAVLWGVENGYVKGTSNTAFSPDVRITRGQTVTFLSRVAGVKDDDTGYTHKFTDVKSTDYYNNAVAWAAANGITSGVDATHFSPESNTTRGQIVVFLYRYYMK